MPPGATPAHPLRRSSYGGTAAIVTSIGLVVGFAAASVSRMAIVGSLLVVGIADNLSDSLSVHLYQESEGLEPMDAIRSTASNFAVRAGVTASFVLLEGGARREQ